MHACAVAMLDLAFEEPADGLQAGVRVWWHVHSGAIADVVRPVVVGEAPRADQGPLAPRQGAAHADGARTAERDFSRMQDAAECRCCASHFGGRGIGIAHLVTLALRSTRQTGGDDPGPGTRWGDVDETPVDSAARDIEVGKAQAA